MDKHDDNILYNYLNIKHIISFMYNVSLIMKALREFGNFNR